MDNFLGMIGLAMRAGKLGCGAYSAVRDAREGRAVLIVAAEDIGAGNRRRIEAVCAECAVPLVLRSTTEELSRGVGRKNVPVVSVRDENFAAAIKKYFTD